LIQHVKYKDHTKQKVNAGSSSPITTDDMIQTAAPQTPQLDIDTPQEPHPMKSTPATSKGTTEKSITLASSKSLTSY
jgi:hypothetical protein